MASNRVVVDDTLKLLKEYTQLKRLIESSKRKNDGHLQQRVRPPSTPYRKLANQLSRSRTKNFNPYIMRANALISQNNHNQTIASKSTAKGHINMPISATDFTRKSQLSESKYSWSSNLQRKVVTMSLNRELGKSASTSPLKSIAISLASPSSSLGDSPIIRKTKTKYRVVNTNPIDRLSSSPSAKTPKTLRQVKKYSLKYVPFNKKCQINGRYVLRRRRSVSLSERRQDIKTQRTNFVVIGKLLYKTSKTKLARTGSAKTGGNDTPSIRVPKKEKTPQSVRRWPRATKERIVSVRGVKFVMDPQRKTLRRIAERSLPASVARGGLSRVDIGSDTFVQSLPGILVRSSGKQLRSLANRVVNKSINRLTVKKQRSQQFCMFFNKFGKCSKRDKGEGCPYIHDVDKIAVCKRLLKGECHVKDCAFSHRLCRLKMPVCTFFLRGKCNSKTCQYRHVNVNREAGVCLEFNRGYCPNGEACKKWHINVCPQFEQCGKCDRADKCPLRHRNQRYFVDKIGKSSRATKSTKRSVGSDCDASSVSTGSSLPAFISLSEFDSPSSTSEVFKEEMKAPVNEEKFRIKPMFLRQLEQPHTITQGDFILSPCVSYFVYDYIDNIPCVHVTI